MKTHNILILGAGILAMATGLWSCQADMDTPELVVPQATIKANTTILELKEAYQGRTVLLGDKDADGTHYIIHGRVVSSDATGNIYKSLVIQDETAALTFSINQGSMYTEYRLGQEVVVDMTGLYLGYYRGLQQVGSPGDPYDGAPQLGFMAYDYWQQHAQKNGMPVPDTEMVSSDPATWPSETPYCIVERIPISQGNLTLMQSQLVELRDVHFVGGGKLTYAPYQETVSRYLKNEAGDSIAVRMSGYSNFYNQTLPTGTGSVRGILGYFNDSWQLTIRGLDDVMIDDLGSKEKPFTVAQAQDPSSQHRTGWVSGYIVGSVKAGVNSVTSNSDVIFGANAEMDNTILIADAADCTDWSKCMLVELPQGSQLRRYANLADNPEVYKKRISVLGEIGTAMAMTALTDCPGTMTDFELEGLEVKPEKEFSQIYSGLDPAATSCDWTFENVSLGQGISGVWSWREFNGNHYLYANSFTGGSARASKAYAVSPVIDLTDMTEAKVSFSHAAKYQNNIKEMCALAVREEGSDSWEQFAIPTWPPADSWTFTSSGDINISKYAGKKVQIGFKYESTDSAADAWEVNSVSVMAR